jgi:hypothetical protein
MTGEIFLVCAWEAEIFQPVSASGSPSPLRFSFYPLAKPIPPTYPPALGILVTTAR